VNMDHIEEMNRETKEAWGENWKDIEIETILGIFKYPRVKKFLNIFTSYLPENGRILEAGCGLGPWVIKLGTLGYKMAGIDYQQACIDKIKAYDNGQEVYTADVRNIPFEDNSFEAYLSWGVIEHFAEGPDKALEEAHRVLKDEGRLVLTVPYKNIFRRMTGPFDLIKRNPFIRGILNKPPRAYYYQKFFRVRELEEAISRSGFFIEKIIPVDQIFSLVEFSSLFRDKDSLDGENRFAVFAGNILEKILPWASAGSTFVVARKKRKK